MRILLDGDGVVFDLLTAIHNLNNNFNPKGVTDYYFKNEDYGIPRKQLMPYVSDSKTFEHQPLYRGAKEGITQMKLYSDIIGWSDVPKHIAPIRKWQFKKLGINNVITDKHLVQTDVVIDDNPEQLARFDDNVLKFLINHPYNETMPVPPNTIRVKNLMTVNKLLRTYIKNGRLPIT